MEGYNPRFIELYTRNDTAANSFYHKQGFIKKCEYYDVFGVEKGLRKPVNVKVSDGYIRASGIGENKKNYGFVIVDGVYEVYNKESIELIDYDRYYPVYGYVKEL